ncbi:conserved hypothetical lipoprotein signal peptide [Chthoniobacter flavus Ellin428]|uniref:Conserved hypothetical lipoprotein signal peptide n=1 Tax=Chthoniobacter flavus Ellin428 TaxID=497964 RepID=B4CYY9_9BACT|nr:phosphodiester glycosidase family protein [Chthoniobacter flavus]EDY20680.1 conserved hypothetical lipoprotein signal peptide [Chthoniobacter flavus Ellin428]TCO89579.1 uncharacterized protein YigE (DUF2233 family) [Chthoniobacter flavus]
MKVWWAIAILAIATAVHRAEAVEFSTVEFAGKTFTVCRVDVRKEHLDLFHRDEHGEPFKRFDHLLAWLEPQHRTLVFAMNAGMYHPDFSAVGLFVSGGRELVPLNTANGNGNFFLKPNGVFALTESGAHVVESSEYPKLGGRVILATQSGPLLVHSGKLHPAIRAESESRLIRNGVGVPSPDTAIFVISEVPVNFYEFATLFRDQLHCPNALFLDGTISSLYSKTLNRHDFHMDLGPIIGVAE